MAGRGIVWTQEEDNILKQYVREHLNTTGLVIEGRTARALEVRLSILRKRGEIPKSGTFNIPENVEIAKEIISNNPDNLRRAFSLIAERFNLSKDTVEVYWYSKNNASPISKHIIGPCFMTVGKKGIVNTKNIAGDTSFTSTTTSLWGSIKMAIRRMFQN